MSIDLFIPIKFKTSVQLIPSELSKNFEDIIFKKIKTSLENVCSKHGYIKNNSIKIIKRSIGSFKKQHFNGNIIFDIECIAEICNPAQGSIIKCTVKAKNSLGILAEGFYDKVPILEIIIPKISAGIQSEINIDKVNIGDEIKIEVCGKKFQLFDKHISIIGKAIKDKEIIIKTIIKTIIETDDNIINDDVNDDVLLPIIDIESEKIVSDDDETDDDVSKKHKDDDEDEEIEDEEEEEDLDQLDDFDEFEEEIEFAHDDED